ncbi:MAG: cytochrome b N-terminal domain-containing protein [Myxococcales bacterium]|nr:cytochrome b N-terminal domain-containing protein [Myxococcales bacterium]
MAGIIDWLDERMGARALARRVANPDIPGGPRLQYVFGAVLVYLFLQEVVLGVLLALYYSPSTATAWASTAYIQDQVTAGWFLRGLHLHTSSAMVVLVVLHFVQVVWTGAYRRPRELIWWSGVLMGMIVLGFSMSGYLLPWDQNAYWGTQVRTGILGSLPGGEPLKTLAQGGGELGNLTLTRFYAIHVFLLPLATALLLAVHLIALRKHGVTPPARLDEAARAQTKPYWPYQRVLDVGAMAVTGAALIAMTVYTHGAQLYAPADSTTAFVARPEWNFLFLYQLVKFFEGPLQIVATAIIPGAVTAALFALPLLDRAPDRSPRRRIWVLAFVGAVMAGVVALTAIAIVDDAGNEKYQKAHEAALQDAARARALAAEGVPALAATIVWENDPDFKVRALFKEHCATCHTIEGKGGQEAPSFDGYSERRWLFDLVRDPTAKRFFGGTKEHNAMEPLPASDVSDEDLWATVEYLYSLRGDAKDIDDAKASRGKALWDDTLECNGCHELERKAEGAAPTLAGRGTLEWIQRVIADSSAPDLFADAAEMPKYKDKLSEDEIAALAQFIVEQGAPASTSEEDATP